MSGAKFERDCSVRCRSLQHGEALAAALSLRGVSSLALASFLHWRCGNCGQVSDCQGRTALHLAASCGLRDVVRWLVRHAGANINAKDGESGYTPLHRSIFYGQIHVAMSLIQLGASVSALDHDELTAIDHTMKDRLPFLEYNLHNPCEVYVWGTNSNFTLGTDSEHSRLLPELLEGFRKQNISVRQVSMHKFHSVFVTHDGRVFSCGHGHGGRLGLDSEQASLTPRQMKLGNNPGTGMLEVCTMASVGRDHTVLLMDSGTVWTCGLNAHHQLGHFPPPSFLLSPRALSHKAMKNAGPVVGICAARFHTVIWGAGSVMTCGLHAGQLGHLKGPEHTQILPRHVTSLDNKDSHITHVAASDGATVVVLKKGDIYVLHEYQCRKIASRQLDVAKVVVVGGHLDSRVDASVLMDRGGEQLKVAILTSQGKLLLWQESSLQLTRCMFNLNRLLMFTDVALNRTQLLLITRDGEAFEGEVKTRKPRKHTPVQPQTQETGRTFHDFLEREDCEAVRLKRLPHVHRAVSIASDLKGRNFAVIQTHPKAALLEVPQVESSSMKEQMQALIHEAHPLDLIHDVVFQVGLRKFASHRYIIASRSEPLAKLIAESVPSIGTVPLVKLVRVRPEIFEQILFFMYTNDCALLHPGICPVKAHLDGNESSNCTDVYGGSEEIIAQDLSGVSAFQVYAEENNRNAKRDRVKHSQNQKRVTSDDPVRWAQEAAKRFAIAGLGKRLEGIRYVDGCITLKDSSLLHEVKPTFDRSAHEDLQDVSIKSEDGQQVRAHKCVLTARLEYFHSLLSHGWIEASHSSMLSLPVPHSVLVPLLDFLYRDEAPDLATSEDLDLVCSMLVVADQLFVNRLKEICEMTLAGLVTLRNVAQLLQFADMYSASQLKACCMQFTCLNLPALLESRTLELVSETVLAELSKYYCELNPLLSKRVITPYSSAPSCSQVETVAETYPICWQDDEDSELIDVRTKKMFKLSKKKPKVRKTSCGESNKTNERTRNESTSSNASLNSDDGDAKGIHSLSFEDLTERDDHRSGGRVAQDVTLSLSKLQTSKLDSPWVKIVNSSKQQKVVQARLRAISAARESPSLVEPGAETFTRLVSASRSTPPRAIPVAQREEGPGSPHGSQWDEPQTPPNLVLDFPQLQRSPPLVHDGAVYIRTPHKVIDVKKHVKISQKQRKKMAGELNLTSMAEELERVSRTRPAWGNVPEPASSNTNSLIDIMRQEQRQSKLGSAPIPVLNKKQPSNVPASPPDNSPIANPWTRCQVGSPGSPGQASSLNVNFSAIVADEKKQRENWTKMRAKPLELTQLEDRAIEALLVFYNAAGATDERITVRRVATGVVATPRWITSHH